MQYYMAYPPYGPPVTKYHEYRFDWLPDRIDYYVDGWLMATFTENIPSSAGAIHLSHWSNGNEHWSQGPPDQDAVMTVAYVKAYFNTTARRTEATENECASLDWTGQNDVMCQIPDQTAPPWPGGPFGNDTGKTSFFTRRMDETVDEPADGPPLRSPAVGRSERLRAAIVLLLTVFWTWMFLEV